MCYETVSLPSHVWSGSVIITHYISECQQGYVITNVQIFWGKKTKKPSNRGHTLQITEVSFKLIYYTAISYQFDIIILNQPKRSKGSLNPNIHLGEWGGGPRGVWCVFRGNNKLRNNMRATEVKKWIIICTAFILILRERLKNYSFLGLFTFPGFSLRCWAVFKAAKSVFSQPKLQSEAPDVNFTARSTAWVWQVNGVLIGPSLHKSCSSSKL